MGADQFPHPETPKVGRSPFPLRESEGHTLPHPPSGNPQGRALPHPPPGIPTGFCHEARGCAAEALPWVKAKDINNPNGVVPIVRMGCMWYWVYICKSFREDSSSPPANPIPFRPLISHPPTGTNGTTPCGVGNALRPEPGVARKPAQPRAVWHNVVDVGGGEMMRAMTHYVHGNAGGRAIAVPPPGIPKVVPCPIPLRESQRDSATKPGVAPPRRYPGSLPNI